MEKYPTIEKYADIALLKDIITNTGQYATITRWTDCAIELEPDLRSRLTQISKIYLEITEDQLTLEQCLRCLNSIMDTIGSDDNLLMLIATQAPEARR